MQRKKDLPGNKSLLVYCYSSQPNFSNHKNIFCWLLQPVQIRLRRLEFLIRFVFFYLRIRAEFSLNKGMLKCKTFIPTLSKLTRTCRRVLLWSHATQTYLSTQTLIRSSRCFLFYRHSSHKLTRPSRHFFFFAVACTDKTVHMDIYLLPAKPAQDNMCVQTDVYFPLSQPT